MDTPVSKIYDENYGIEDEIEKAMKKAYEVNFDKQIKEDMAKWMESVSERISSKCRDQGENSAFNMFFKEFCESLFPSICEKSLDFAFANIEDYEEDEFAKTIEHFLEKKYFESIEKEASKAAIDSPIGHKLTVNLDSKISKQIRYMKSHEKTVIWRDPYRNTIEKVVYLRK